MKLRLNWLELLAIGVTIALIYLPLLAGTVDSAARTAANSDIIAVAHKESDKQAKGDESEGKGQFDASDFIALGALLVLAVQTGILARQTKLLNWQTSITNKAYITDHRPKLIVRDVYLVRNNGLDGYNVHYILANIGGSKASIIAGGFRSHKWRTAFAPFAEASEKSRFPAQVSLHAGESFESFVPVEISREEMDEIMARGPDGAAKPAHDLVFRGGLVYIDENGIKRRMAVWRTCEGPPSLRMTASEDQEYEYAD